MQTLPRFFNNKDNIDKITLRDNNYCVLRIFQALIRVQLTSLIIKTHRGRGTTITVPFR